MRHSLLQALDYMPVHRQRSKRSATLTLDVLLEEGRNQKVIAPGTLDLILMGYRYFHLFQRELKNFQKKPLHPAELADLWQLTLAALLTRDKTPAAVLVSESVEVARKVFGEKTTAITNAFLRQVLRQLDQLQTEVRNNPEILLGENIFKRWASIAPTRRQIAQAVAERPPSGIQVFNAHGEFKIIASGAIEDFSPGILGERLDPPKALEAPQASEPPKSSEAPQASEPPPASENSSLAIQAMDLGSWTYMQWLHAKINEDRPAVALKILDACAAPGGKLLALHTLLPKNRSHRYFATDAKYSRLTRLRENLLRWQISNISVELYSWGQSNEAVFAESDFDLIMVDLPCTGSGTLHTRPDLLSENFTQRLQTLMPLQRAILTDLKTRLRPGGRLAVSVCSIDPEELSGIDECLGRRSPDFCSLNVGKAGDLKADDPFATRPEAESMPAKMIEGIAAWWI